VSWAKGAAAFPREPWIDTLSQNGMLVNYVWEPKVYGVPAPSAHPAPNAIYDNWGSGYPFYSWQQVTSGALDGLFAEVATAVKALPYNINIQICSERDTDHFTGGTVNGIAKTWPQLDVESVPAIQHIIGFFKNTMGVTNATFSGGMAGLDHDSFVRCYVPDADYVQYNAYNHGGWRSPYEVFNRTYQWLADLPSSSASKPVWIAEWGCDADPRRPQYFAEVADAISRLPRISYLSYFNSTWGAISGADTTSMQALADCFDHPLFGGAG
jgi:hypothetical protein